jgi:hypothetical protein
VIISALCRGQRLLADMFRMTEDPDGDDGI